MRSLATWNDEENLLRAYLPMLEPLVPYASRTTFNAPAVALPLILLFGVGSVVLWKRTEEAFAQAEMV